MCIRDRYEGALKKFLDHYDEICDIMEFADQHNLDGKELLDIVKSKDNASL